MTRSIKSQPKLSIRKLRLELFKTQLGIILGTFHINQTILLCLTCTLGGEPAHLSKIPIITGLGSPMGWMEQI